MTLPSGLALSALVYVDHNLGTVVKDAFLVPEPMEDLTSDSWPMCRPVELITRWPTPRTD